MKMAIRVFILIFVIYSSTISYAQDKGCILTSEQPHEISKIHHCKYSELLHGSLVVWVEV